MIKPVTIPIFHHTDQTANLEEMGLDDKTSLEDCEERDMTFYNIDATDYYLENDIKYGSIICGGQVFISPWDKERIDQEILKSLS
jgi:hypothetical protein